MVASMAFASCGRSLELRGVARFVCFFVQPSRNSAVLELGGPSALEGVDVAVCGETNGVPEPERCLHSSAEALQCTSYFLCWQCLGYLFAA